LQISRIINFYHSDVTQRRVSHLATQAANTGAAVTDKVIVGCKGGHQKIVEFVVLKLHAVVRIKMISCDALINHKSHVDYQIHYYAQLGMPKIQSMSLHL